MRFGAEHIEGKETVTELEGLQLLASFCKYAWQIEDMHFLMPAIPLLTGLIDKELAKRGYKMVKFPNGNYGFEKAVK